METRRTYIRIRNIVPGVNGHPVNTPFYLLLPEGGTPAENDQAFYNLSPDQKLALATSSIPASVNGWEERPETGKGSAKLTELFIARNPDNTLSLYANGTGKLYINLVAAAGTPAYPNGLKEMVTVGGPWPREGLFVGAKPYGSYFLNVPNGNYVILWVDEDHNFRSFSVTLTKSQPFATLFGTGSPTNPTTPTNPTDPNLPPTNNVYPDKGALVGYTSA